MNRSVCMCVCVCVTVLSSAVSITYQERPHTHTHTEPILSALCWEKCALHPNRPVTSTSALTLPVTKSIKVFKYIFLGGRDATVELVDQMAAPDFIQRQHKRHLKAASFSTGERKVWGQEVLTEMCCEYCWHQCPSHVGISVLPFVTQLALPSRKHTKRERS